MTTLTELREQVFTRARNRCEWPWCGSPADELAHIRHRGMGGDPTANTASNTLALCRPHHRRYDDAQLEPRDLYRLLKSLRDQSRYCEWSACVNTDLLIAPVQPSGGSSWSRFTVCPLHAACLNLDTPVPGRRHEIGYLLREVADRATRNPEAWQRRLEHTR